MRCLHGAAFIGAGQRIFGLEADRGDTAEAEEAEDFPRRDDESRRQGDQREAERQIAEPAALRVTPAFVETSATK
ncbi:MAG: hypothetical protein HC850_11565 [Rhodomicrobium sp.]|nr:hypothetical protein [Rhodomicrobium sp.]